MAKILFKDGKIQFDATGKILFTQAGDDPADCACCGGGCTASATSCTHCTDVTPSQYRVTFSGFSLCSCTQQLISGSASPVWQTGFSDATINDTHTLTQESSCTWTKTIDATFPGDGLIQADEYSSSDCTGGLTGGQTDFRIRIVLTRTASSWVLDVHTTNGRTSTTPRNGLFYDTVAEDAVGTCGTIGNTFTSECACTGIDASGSGFHDYGSGGSATVVCL